MDQDNSLNSKLSIAEEAFLHCPKCKALFARNIAYCTADGTKLEETDSEVAKTSAFAGKYEILDEIGSGGMGTVYRVRQVLLDKVFALKVIPAESLNDLLITRFQREAKMMAALDHANLGRIIDFGIYQNQPFMVMEFIDGIPLNKLLSESQLSIDEIIDIFCQILDALAHAHKKGVLHRDVKPSNIMIVQSMPEGHTKTPCTRKAILLDFGIAKKFDPADDTNSDNTNTQALTRTGEMIGSPLYMSPEHAHGDRLTERSDLYSLGCALFECLTGTAPFVGKSSVDTLIMHMEKTAPTLKEASLGQEFPAGLERVVRKLLSKDPAQRYQSADETKRALALALKLDEAQIDEKPPEESAVVLSRPYVILAAVLILATVSIIAFLTAQGEKAARKSSEPIKEDKIKLESALLELGDEEYIIKPRKNSPDSEDNYEESEEDDDEGSAPKDKYTPLSGKEEGLALRFETLEDERVKLLEQNNRLQRLGLAQAKFPHRMLGNLSGRLIALRLSGAKLSDDDMKYVVKNTALEKLILNANPITDKGVSQLASLRLLKVLDLAKTKCSAESLNDLKTLPLMTLYLHNCERVDDRAAEVVSSMAALEELSLENTRVTGKGVGYLHRLPKLSTLSLGKLRLQDKDISSLKLVQNLPSLRLVRNKITSAGIKSLIPLKHLTFLDLESNPIDDTAVDSILQMTQLQNLNLSGTQLTPQAMMKLADLPALKTLSVRRLAGLNEAMVHEFMTKCDTVEEIVFLRHKDSGYRRPDWEQDERNSALLKKANHPSE